MVAQGGHLYHNFYWLLLHQILWGTKQNNYILSLIVWIWSKKKIKRKNMPNIWKIRITNVLNLHRTKSTIKYIPRVSLHRIPKPQLLDLKKFPYPDQLQYSESTLDFGRPLYRHNSFCAWVNYWMNPQFIQTPVGKSYSIPLFTGYKYKLLQC